MRSLVSRLSFALVAAMAFMVTLAAPATPAAALDGAGIATAGVADLTALVTDALPFIVAAIGLAIVLRWVRKVFKF